MIKPILSAAATTAMFCASLYLWMPLPDVSAPLISAGNAPAPLMRVLHSEPEPERVQTVQKSFPPEPVAASVLRSTDSGPLLNVTPTRAGKTSNPRAEVPIPAKAAQPGATLSQAKEKPGTPPDVGKADSSVLAKRHPTVTPGGTEFIGGTIDMDVPAGAALPVVLLDSVQLLSAEQAGAMDATADQFVKEVAQNPAAQTSDPQLAAVIWDGGRQRANERYRLLFGDDAANRELMRAALEMLPPHAR
jgi:hypothetical protein